MERMVLSFGNTNTGLFISPGTDIRERLPKENVLKVYDPVTYRLLGAEGTEDEGIVIIPRGEEAKNWGTAENIFTAAVKAGLSRDSCIAGIGGGMLCDLAAFAASSYMRGCRLILVPTTLLAMVDAAIGGKTGFNYLGLKNMIGTFYPAEEVYLFPEVLKTLPEEEFLCGIAETIKHACLGDPELFSLLEQRKEQILAREKETLLEMVKKSVLVKCRIVERDPVERGERVFLNFGHTFGHALESVLGFSESRHGEAVAWGMVKAAETGTRLGLTDPEYARRVTGLIRSYGFPFKYDVPAEKLLHAMEGDKKKHKGRVRFILQKKMGETVAVPVEPALLREILSS